MPSESKRPNRRRYARHKCHIPAVLNIGLPEPLRGVIVNISRRGACFEPIGLKGIVVLSQVTGIVELNGAHHRSKYAARVVSATAGRLHLHFPYKEVPPPVLVRVGQREEKPAVHGIVVL